ncbi:MAG: hypothetical protein ACRDLD_02365 [Thermoleophilaceae bacterium]
MSFDPGEVMNAVEDGADRLEKAADAYSDAVKRFEDAQNDYERDFQKQLLVIADRARKAGERVPAGDLRSAEAHQKLDSKVYGEYLAAKAEKEALATRYRALAAAVSARQSLLKALGSAG